REEEVHHLPTAELQREAAAARACRQAVVHHAWSVAICRVQSVMLPCASMLHKRLPGPATAPGAPGTGGCAPCPHAPVPSAAGAYSPRWCPVCQAGKGAHRHLDRSISATTVPPAVTHGASGEAR